MDGRRGTAAAGEIPVRSMSPGSAGDASSQGHPSAHSRPAVSTRVHQSGGSPTHEASASIHRPGRSPPAQLRDTDQNQTVVDVPFHIRSCPRREVRSSDGWWDVVPSEH
jgi:hypothetical protein